MTLINKPDYLGNSIVNLITSVAKSFTDESILYNELHDLPSIELKKYDNIVFFVIDGLGYEYIKKYGQNSLIYSNTKSKLTSVFPTTTASAMSVFATCRAPLEHGMMGWFMKLQGKFGAVPSVVLPFLERGTGIDLLKRGIVPKNLFTAEKISHHINMSAILPADIIDTTYTTNMLFGKGALGYKNIDEFFDLTVETVKKNSQERKLVFSYLPHFDSLFHSQGEANRDLYDLFKLLNTKLGNVIKELKGTNSLIILTADHGLIDSEKGRQIDMASYPHIKKLLNFPLCGEPRTSYCYVDKENHNKFVNYVQNDMNNICSIYTREELLELNMFGLFGQKSDIIDRIGDYILIMKDNYVLKDFIGNEKKKFHAADHGGISDNEMFVPLAIFEP